MEAGRVNGSSSKRAEMVHGEDPSEIQEGRASLSHGTLQGLEAPKEAVTAGAHSIPQTLGSTLTRSLERRRWTVSPQKAPQVTDGQT